MIASADAAGYILLFDRVISATSRRKRALMVILVKKKTLIYLTYDQGKASIADKVHWENFLEHFAKSFLLGFVHLEFCNYCEIRSLSYLL